MGGQKGHVVDWGGIEHHLEFWVYWNRERRPSLLLTQSQHALPYVLSSQPDYIGTPLSCVEQQAHRQPRSRSDWMPCLELADVFVSPCVESVRAIFRRPHADSRIVGTETGSHRMAHQGTQADQEIQRSTRGSRLGPHHALDVTLSERSDGFFPVLLAESLEYSPASASGGRREPGREDTISSIVEKFGGVYRARGGKMEVLESDLWTPSRVVVIEFPSMAQAKTCLGSAEYLAVRPLRHANAKATLLILDGLPC